MRKYLLDPYIVSILFRTKDDEETLSTYSSLMSRLFLLIEETIRYYLKQRQIDDNKIAEVLNALENPDNAVIDEGIKGILREEEMIKLLTDSIDSFGKLFYENLLPTLPAEDRKEITRYLEAVDPIVQYNTLLSLSTLIDLDTNKIKELDLEKLSQDSVELSKSVEESDKFIKEDLVTAEPTKPVAPIEELNKPVVATIMDDINEIKEGTKSEPELPDWLANIVNSTPAAPSPTESVITQNPLINQTVETIPNPVATQPVEQTVQETIPQQNPITPVANDSSPMAEAPVQTEEPQLASQSPNLISQLEDMGINLDDNSSVAPTSAASPDNVPTPQ